MNSRHGILKRVVALLVISLTCVCLAEDLFALNPCTEERGPLVSGNGNLVIRQSPQQSSSPSSTDGDHDCLCCCHHVVPGVIFQPDQNWSFSFIEFASNRTTLS